MSQVGVNSINNDKRLIIAMATQLGGGGGMFGYAADSYFY